jgi:hypothetical protein
MSHEKGEEFEREQNGLVHVGAPGSTEENPVTLVQMTQIRQLGLMGTVQLLGACPSVDTCNQGSTLHRNKLGPLSACFIPPRLEQLLHDELSPEDHMDQKMADMLSSLHSLYESSLHTNEHNYGEYFHNLVYLENYAGKIQ